MSTQSNITSFALQDILLGIAGSLNDAQQTLQELPPYDAFGRPNTMYQVPYLDFNLQVTSEFEEVTEDNSTQTRSFLKFQSAKSSPTSSSSSSSEINSSISGRFVAIVPNEGLPQVVIQLKADDPVLVTGGTHYDIGLEVLAGNAVGEILINTTVEFNYNDETSLALNGAALSEDPTFDISEIQTDQEGKAKIIVTVPKADYDNGNYAVIVANIGTVAKTIALSNN